VKIGQYDVKFVPRQVIKSQALPDFIAELTDSGLQGIDELSDNWVMYFDRSYTLKGAEYEGLVILKYAIQHDFPATNNITEYEGLVMGVQLAKDLRIQRLLIRGDSQLVVKQV
jgi:hypothetical protein